MRRITSFLAVLLLSLFAAGSVFAYSAADMTNRHSREGGNPEVDPAAQARISESYGKLPLAFEVNKGQTDEQVKFLSRGQGYGLYLTPTEAVMVLNSSRPETADGRPEKASDFPLAKGDQGGLASDPSVLRLSLANANKHPKLVGEETQPGTSNYFTGNDPEKWRMRVANYGKVRYTGVYDGVDLVYYGNQRKLEYDFIVQPGADYRQIRLNIQGADNVSIDDDGNLVLHMRDGDVVQHKPVVYQTENAINREDAENTKESTETERDQSPPPPLKRGSGFYPLSQRGENKTSPFAKGDRGGFAPTGRYVILADAGGTACLECGDASPPLQSADKSAHSKTKTGATSGTPTGTLVGFEIENYDPSKPLVIDPVLSYSTYLGGANIEVGSGIAVDSSGNAYITGYTQSSNFPTTTGAYHTVRSTGGGNYDGFVIKLNSTGTLIYSTFFGGGGSSYGLDIAVDSSGNGYITGYTAGDFPTTAGAYQTSRSGSAGNNDAFVIKLNSTGTALVYSTYIGGIGDDIGLGIAVDSSGNAYITGYTYSSNFPTTVGAYQTAIVGSPNAFVSKLNSTGTALVYSTYLGGSGTDYSSGIAVDSSGNAYITGHTYSSNFPTTAGAYQTASGSGPNYSDAFVTKLNSTGAALSYSTYLGSSGSDQGNAIAVDSSGNAYITGYTQSSNFPTTAGAYQTASGGSSDAFVAKLNSLANGLIYSTYLGGSDSDYGYAIAVDSSGNAYITGHTQSSNFPTTAGAYQTASGGGDDAFVSKLNSLANGLIYSAYLGGSGSDQGNAIAVDSSGNAYITGTTPSTNFPTTAGAYQTSNGSQGSQNDAFVAKLDLSATALTTTTTSVASSLNPSTQGASVTFTASVSGSGGTPTGTVTFKDGSTTLGTGALSGGQATYSASSLSNGTHSITAVYGGDTNFASSTSPTLTQTVTAVNSTATTTSTSIASSLNPSTAGASVTFTASVSGSGGTPTGTVTFASGTTSLPVTLSNGTAILTTSSLSAGTYSITAAYGGDTSYASSTSSILTQTVNPNSGTTTTSTSVTSSSTNNSSTLYEQVVLTVTVTGNNPTGTVVLKDGTTTLVNNGTLVSGRLTYITPELSVGAHSITAVYAGDTNNSGSTSPVYTHTVRDPNSGTTTTSTSIVSSLNPSTAGASVTFTASVTGGFLTPTGSVTFKDGSTTLGTGTLSSGQATYSTSSLSSMVTHSITAVYGGDTNFAASTSSALTQTVTTVTSGANGYSGTYSGQGMTIHLTQSSSTLSGTFSAPGGLTGNMGGFIDSSNRAYVWAWWDSSSSGSGVLAGNLPVSGNQTTFGFGGGQSSGGRIGQVVLNGLTQGSLSGTTTISTGGSSSANYAGTYTGQGITIILTQSGSTLSGTFSATGGPSGNMGGFVDSSGRAYVWAYWNSSSSGSGVAAGKLTVTTRSTTTPGTPTTNLPTASDTSQATFSFGGGQSSGGIIGEIVLSDMTLQ